MAKIKNADIEIIASQGNEEVSNRDQSFGMQNMHLKQQDIENLIYIVRNSQVMLDSDLAMLYGIETKRLKEQVKRNINRFPDDFMFQLTIDEAKSLRSQIATLNPFPTRSQIATLNTGRGHNIKYQPYVFTESGVAMLSGILRSEIAVEVNIRIMRAFVAMRHFLASNAQIFQRLEVVEHHQLEISAHQSQTDHQIEEIFKRLDQESITPTQGIFFDGQIFDAHIFVSDLIRSAKKRIVLFDNYIDDTVLTLLDKRKKNVGAEIYTKSISSQLSLDIARHNAQYRPITVTIFNRTHDRFLCIDNTVYHIGASLKDLGRRWFAFSKMEMPAEALINKI